MDAANNENILPWFFKKADPILKFFNKLDNSHLVGLIFATIVLIFMVGCWYWVFYKNGAQSWYEGIIRYYKKKGMNVEPLEVLFSPLILKIFITFALMVSLVFVFFASMV